VDVRQPREPALSIFDHFDHHSQAVRDSFKSLFAVCVVGGDQHEKVVEERPMGKLRERIAIRLPKCATEVNASSGEIDMVIEHSARDGEVKDMMVNHVVWAVFGERYGSSGVEPRIRGLSIVGGAFDVRRCGHKGLANTLIKPVVVVRHVW
jgi:hypothetical protein